MKNYQVIPVSGLMAEVKQTDGLVFKMHVFALAFHESEDGELRVKGITKSDLMEGWVDFEDGNYEFINGIEVLSLIKDTKVI